MDSLNMYRELEQQGYDVGLRQCGSLNLAQSQDRMIALQRRMSYNKPNGLECELVTPERIKEIHPYLNVDDLRGGGNEQPRSFPVSFIDFARFQFSFLKIPLPIRMRLQTR